MDDLTRKTIKTRINTALVTANLKQKDLAKELNVTDNTVSYWCNGTRTPNTEQIIQIARALKVSTDYLLGLSDVATTNVELKAICEYTGLFEDSIESLHKFFKSDGHFIFDFEPFFVQEDFYFSPLQTEISTEILNYFLSDKTNGYFTFIYCITTYLAQLTKVCTELENTINNINQLSTTELIDKCKKTAELESKAKYAFYDCIETYEKLIKRFCKLELDTISKNKALIYTELQKRGDIKCPQ